MTGWLLAQSTPIDDSSVKIGENEHSRESPSSKFLSEEVPSRLPSEPSKPSEMEDIRRAWLQEIQTRSDKAKLEGRSLRTQEQSQSRLQRLNDSARQKSELLQKKAQDKVHLANPGQTKKKAQGSISTNKKSTSTNNIYTTEQVAENPSFTSAILRFAGLISICLLILYLALRFFRLRGGGAFRRGDDLVELIVSVPLVQGKFLQVVDVAGQLLVLGVSDSGVELLTSIEDGMTADRIRLWQSRQSSLASNVKMKMPTLLEKLFILVKGETVDHPIGRRRNKEKNFAAVLDSFGGSGKSNDVEKKNDNRVSDTDQLKEKLQRQKKRLTQMLDSNIESVP